MSSNEERLNEIRKKISPYSEKSQDAVGKDKRDGGNNNAESAFRLIKARFTLEKDVVLPPSTQAQIDEALAKINYHKTMYVDWNFMSVDPMGKGVNLLFYGKPGTGKTLTAEGLAGTLGKNFLSLGLSDVESKYMGETAKNITKAFKEATENDAVLFFDEADTLLGKRLSNVTQGLDNEVNSLRSTMLMELEKFEGIAIFATNFQSNIDSAFESRMSHEIEFELPDAAGRKILWEKFLVPSVPIADGENRDEIISKAVDISDGFSGRSIRNSLRLALPKAILEGQNAGTPPALKWAHVEAAIEQAKKGARDVGKGGAKGVDSQAFSMIGVK
jgi:SpoVK/Ycf46/Vps4 family AAA+-type ATPase